MPPQVDVMIIGAGKAGTTSLKHYLASHPAVVTHREMEFTHFSDANPTDRGFEEAYGEHFADEVARARPTTPMLLAKHARAFTDVAELLRITSHNPRCRLILSLRDPVARAFSAYRLDSLTGVRQRPFAEAMDALLEERPEDDYRWRTYIDAGRYGHHLARLREAVPDAALRIVFFDDLAERPEGQIRDLYGWIGVDPKHEPAVGRHWNSAPAPRSTLAARALVWLGGDDNPVKAPVRRLMPRDTYRGMRDTLLSANRGWPREVRVATETRRKLDRFYRSDSERLVEILGRPLPWSAPNRSSR